MAPSESDIKLSQKIKRLIEKRGLNPNAVARKAGIDNANFYRLLRNERKWQFAHLDKICEALSISIKDLFGEPLIIPIVAKVSALKPFPYPHDFEKGIGSIEYHGTDWERKDLYAIEISDRSFMPTFNIGTHLIIQKDSSDHIKDESLVVYPDDKGETQVCRVQFTSKDSITLRSINPTIPDRILPRTHLKLCELVVSISLNVKI